MSRFKFKGGTLDTGDGRDDATELVFAAGSGVTLTSSYSGHTETLEIAASGGGGGAPTTADYLVKTANAGLSAERVVTDEIGRAHV